MDSLHLCINVIGQLMMQLHDNEQHNKESAVADQLMGARTECRECGQYQQKDAKSSQTCQNMEFFLLFILKN